MKLTDVAHGIILGLAAIEAIHVLKLLIIKSVELEITDLPLSLWGLLEGLLMMLLVSWHKICLLEFLLILIDNLTILLHLVVWHQHLISFVHNKLLLLLIKLLL